MARGPQGAGLDTPGLQYSDSNLFILLNDQFFFPSCVPTKATFVEANKRDTFGPLWSQSSHK